MPGNIFLVGMMGAGKTSVGKMLARNLGKAFHDSDHVIESRTGVKIPVIFELEGEAGFRAREAAVIEELTALQEVVLATGGGAVLDASNRALLQAGGTVVYLRASVNELWNRTRHDRNRPLLQTRRPARTAARAVRAARPAVPGGGAPRGGHRQPEPASRWCSSCSRRSRSAVPAPPTRRPPSSRRRAVAGAPMDTLQRRRSASAAIRSTSAAGCWRAPS